VVSSASAEGNGGGWTSGASSPALADGAYTAVAIQKSSLGNPPGQSSPVTFTIETSAPHVTLDAVNTPSGDTTPSFSGTASDHTGVSVYIYAGSSPGGTLVSGAAATGTGGGWSSGHASPPPAAGTYTAVATQESSLGNPAGESGAVSFTINTATPAVTLDPPALRSSNATPGFTGTASDTTPVTVHVYEGTKPEGTIVATATATGTGGSWASGAVSPSLATGRHT